MQTMLVAGDEITYPDPEEARKAGDADGFERAWNSGKNKIG